MLTDSNRLSCVFLAAGNSAGIFTALLCPSADFLSLWMDSPGASQPQHWESGFFFLPIEASCPLVCPAVLWGLIWEPRTFHLRFRQCFLSSLCSGGFGHLWNSQYFTRLHHLLFPLHMDTLIMVRLWLDQYFSSWNCVQAWEWDLVWHPSNWALATSHYQCSILRCTMLFPTQLCLVNLQLSFSVFFLWWQCLRCDKCWSEKKSIILFICNKDTKAPFF